MITIREDLTSEVDPLMTRRTVVITLLVIGLLAQIPYAYAHGGSGPVSPLSLGLGIGGLLTLILAALLASRGNRRIGVVIFSTGVVLISLAGADIVTDSTRARPPDVQVEIVRPADGSTVSSPVEFEVRVIGGNLIPLGQTEGTATDGHLHVIANGRPIDMPVTEKFAVNLPPGKYSIGIEFTGPDHQSYDPPIFQRILIQVVASSDLSATGTRLQ